MADSRNGGTAALLAFLAGAAVGAGAALLLAPRTGRETRRALRSSLDGVEGPLKAGLDRGLALLDDARARLGEAVEAGRLAARREAARLSREWSAPERSAAGPGADPTGSTASGPARQPGPDGDGADAGGPAAGPSGEGHAVPAGGAR